SVFPKPEVREKAADDFGKGRENEEPSGLNQIHGYVLLLIGDNVSSSTRRIKFRSQGRRWTICKPRVRLVLDEQQTGIANFFPGGRTEKGLKIFDGIRECGFHFPEDRIATRWVVVRCGLSNQIVKPLSLLVGECDGLITGMPWQNEPRPFPERLTDRSSTEPYEPPFCSGIISHNAALEKTTYPRGRDTRAWHGMVEPLADVECEPSAFKEIQHRPS